MPNTRLLVSLAVGVTIFSIGFIYALCLPKTYRATGVVEMLASGEKVVTVERAMQVFRLPELAQGVDKRLLDEERRQLLSAYREIKFDSQLSAASAIVSAFSDFEPILDQHSIRVSFEHPDPVMAANICNLYIREYVDYWLKEGIDVSMKAVEAQRIRADQAKDRVETIEMDLAKIRVERLNAEPQQIEALDNRYNELLKILETEQLAFEVIVRKMTQEKAIISLGPARIRITEEAKLPTTPSNPNIPVWTALSALAGILSSLSCFKLSKLVG